MRNVIQQTTMTSNTRATTTVKTTQTTKSTTKKKRKKKQKTNNYHEQCFYVDLPWPLPQEHPKGAQESPKRLLRTDKSRTRDPQSAPRNIARSKQSNLKACRRILRACRHSGTSRKGSQATILETFDVFRAPKTSPRGPQVLIYRPCQRSIARNVLAFEFWAIGPRCRSNCMHF